MLGDSFLFRVARALRAYLADMHRRGTSFFAARRYKVSISHLLPLGDGWRFLPERRREVFTDVGPDGSPCSPSSASNLAYLFSVLHTGLISGKLAAPSGSRSGVRERQNGDHPGSGSLQDTHRFRRGRARGDDVVDHQHIV